MSGVPVICSCLRLSLTVERPLNPITIAAMPNPIRTTDATTPPISNTFLMPLLPSPLGLSAARVLPGSPRLGRGCHEGVPRCSCGFFRNENGGSPAGKAPAKRADDRAKADDADRALVFRHRQVVEPALEHQPGGFVDGEIRGRRRGLRAHPLPDPPLARVHAPGAGADDVAGRHDPGPAAEPPGARR